LAARAPKGTGAALAARTIESGAAWEKFQRICEAQGGLRTPTTAPHTRPWLADKNGRLSGIDNRKLARTAKLAGAPGSKAAGLRLHVKIGDRVDAGQPLFTVHAQTRGELEYALDYVRANPDVVTVMDTAEDQS
jgi:thymidine phosphorylase